MKLIASLFAIVALTAVTAQACPPQLLGQCYSQQVVQRVVQPVVQYQQVYAAPIVQRQVVEYQAVPVQQVQKVIQYQQQAVVQRVVQKDKVRLRLRSPFVRQRVSVQRLAY